jgi:hypothetical protein
MYGARRQLAEMTTTTSSAGSNGAIYYTKTITCPDENTVCSTTSVSAGVFPKCVNCFCTILPINTYSAITGEIIIGNNAECEWSNCECGK